MNLKVMTEVLKEFSAKKVQQRHPLTQDQQLLLYEFIEHWVNWDAVADDGLGEAGMPYQGDLDPPVLTTQEET